MKRHLINYTYPRSSANLLFCYMNTFIRRAIGLQFGTFFIGILRSDPNPARIVSISTKEEEG